MRKLAFLAFLLTLCLGYACNREQPSNETELREAQAREQTLRGAPLAFQCTDISAHIPTAKGSAVEGKTCKENKAVVNGWSLVCVLEKDCDTAARLAEVNQEMAKFCAEWCSKKQCAYIFTKTTKCDPGYCPENPLCVKNCDRPNRDTCMSYKKQPDFNCECIEKVTD